MALTYILVDFENVQPQDMSLLYGGPYQVRIFHGPHQNKLDIAFAKAVQPLGENVTYVQIDRQGKNALDFHVAFYIGQLLQSHAAGANGVDRSIRFAVISKDTGFDPLLRHVEGLGYRAKRSASIRAALGLDAEEIPHGGEPGTSGNGVAPGPEPLAGALERPVLAATAEPASPPPTAKAPNPKAPKAKAPAAKLPADARQKVIENLRKSPKNRPAKRKTLERHIASILGGNIADKVLQKLMADLMASGAIKLTDKGVEYKLPKAKQPVAK